MIDFRYHVVSIVAVFLALTVGLVIGASILSKGLADSLRGSLAQANTQIKSQQGQLNQLKGEIEQRDKYIAATAAGLVAHQLDAGCVAVIQLAGDDSDAAGAVTGLLQKQSGAMLCSQTTLNAAFTADGSAQLLSSLLLTHTPAGQTLTGATVQQKAAQLLAEALTTMQPGGGTAAVQSPSPSAKATPSGGTGTTPPAGPGASGMTASEAASTLKAFQTDGLITQNAAPTEWNQPNLAYLAAPGGTESDTVNQTYLALAQALRKGGALPVVGGSAQSADKGGLISAVIGDAGASHDIPTVDDTDSTIGQVASVFCLAGLLQGGTVVAGHYGTGADNDGLVPPNLAGLG